jgi:hypothetical protein
MTFKKLLAYLLVLLQIALLIVYIESIITRDDNILSIYRNLALIVSLPLGCIFLFTTKDEFKKYKIIILSWVVVSFLPLTFGALLLPIFP